MPLVNIVVGLLLVAANGFFVACEFSLVAVRPTRVQQLKRAGDSRARVVEFLLKDLDRILSGVQFGITMSSLALGWLGEVTLAGVLVPVLESLQMPWATAVAHGVAITVAFRPLINLFDSASNVILQAMGYRAVAGHALVRSTEELRLLLHQVHEHGVLAPQQARMLEGALELSEVEVRQVMTPRRDMVCLPASASLEQVLEVVRSRRRSRYPVYEGSPEQVIGAVHAKDLFRHLEARLRLAERGGRRPAFDRRAFVRECLFVRETRPLALLLEDFRRQRVHLAMVGDEFGSVQGMVTLADTLEPIVGEVRDE